LSFYFKIKERVMKSGDQHKKEAGETNFNDSDIERSLKDAFGKHSGLKVHGLDLKVRHGEVTIEGKVADATQRARAGAMAEKIKGVKAVENKIMVGVVGDSAEKSAEKMSDKPADKTKGPAAAHVPEKPVAASAKPAAPGRA
jgi:hypothetical protein